MSSDSERKHKFRIERAAGRRVKNKLRIHRRNFRRLRTEICRTCGTMMTWCSICHMFSCCRCDDYGTCMCN